MKINKHAFWQLKINKFYLIAFVAVVILGGVIAQVAPDAFCSNNPDKCIQLFPAGTTDNFGNPLDEETSNALPHSDNEQFKFTNNDSGKSYFIPFEGQNELKQAAVSSREGYLDGKIEICVDGQSESYSINGEVVPGCTSPGCNAGASCTNSSECGESGTCFSGGGVGICVCPPSPPFYYGCATASSNTMSTMGSCETSDPLYNNEHCTGASGFPVPTPVGPTGPITCCDTTPVHNICEDDPGNTGGNTGGGSCTSPFANAQEACADIGIFCAWDVGEYCSIDHYENYGCRSANFDDGAGSCERVACYPPAGVPTPFNNCF